MHKRSLNNDINNNNNKNRKLIEIPPELLAIGIALQHIYVSDAVINWKDFYSPYNYGYVRAFEVLGSTCKYLHPWRPTKNKYLIERRKIPSPILQHYSNVFSKMKNDHTILSMNAEHQCEDDIDRFDRFWKTFISLIQNLPPGIPFGDDNYSYEVWRVTTFFAWCARIGRSNNFTTRVLSNYKNQQILLSGYFKSPYPPELPQLVIEAELYQTCNIFLDTPQTDRPKLSKLLEVSYNHNPKDPQLFYIVFAAAVDFHARTTMHDPDSIINPFLDFVEKTHIPEDSINESFLGVVCMIAILSSDLIVVDRLCYWLESRGKADIFSIMLKGYLDSFGARISTCSIFRDELNYTSGNRYSLRINTYEFLYRLVEMAIEKKCLPVFCEGPINNVRRYFVEDHTDTILFVTESLVLGNRMPGERTVIDKKDKKKMDILLYNKLFDYIEEMGLTTNAKLREECNRIYTSGCSFALKEVLEERNFVVSSN